MNWKDFFENITSLKSLIAQVIIAIVILCILNEPLEYFFLESPIMFFLAIMVIAAGVFVAERYIVALIQKAEREKEREMEKEGENEEEIF